MNWAQLSDNLIYSAIAVYAITMLAFAAEAARRARTPLQVAETHALVGGGGGPSVMAEHDLSQTQPRAARLGRVAVSLTVLAFALHAAGLLARGIAAGRAPWGNMYEFAVAGALAATGAYLVLLGRQPVRDLGVWIVGVVTLTLGLAVTVLYTPAGDLVPALNSYWLVIHVASAIVAGGVFTVGAGAAVLYLVRLWADSRTAASRASTPQTDLPVPAEAPVRRVGYAAQLPSSSALERATHAVHVFAFPVWTFAVIAGAIWAEDSWGRYWGWDPKETWAFITWVLYAAYLHAQSTAGWRGRKATWFALLGYLAFLFNFFGVNIWLPGLHSYAGV